MSQLPEFVFVNTCYSGTVEPGKEMAYRKRYQLAANIGVQLIERGVKAVIVAGWPVNDLAALLFAKKLYEYMLWGETFGEAVKRARNDCYVEYPNTNTWGAYQCYGDYWYRLVSHTAGGIADEIYITEDQVEIDLYNLKSDTEDRSVKP